MHPLRLIRSEETVHYQEASIMKHHFIRKHLFNFLWILSEESHLRLKTSLFSFTPSDSTVESTALFLCDVQSKLSVLFSSGSGSSSGYLATWL